MKFKSPVGSSSPGSQTVGSIITETLINATQSGSGPILEKATDFIKQQARSWFVSTYVDPVAEFIYHSVHGYEKSIDNTLVDLGINNSVVWWSVFLGLMLVILLLLVYISKQSLFLVDIIKSFFFIDYKPSTVVKDNVNVKKQQ
jgi:hypothetical protein